MSKKIAKATLLTFVIAIAFVGLLQTSVQPAQAQLATQQPVSGSLPAGVTPTLTVKIKAYLSFRPNPVGVGQTILVNMWTTPSVNPNRFHQNYRVTIMKPDGTTDTKTLNSYCADATAWFEYAVDQVGRCWKKGGMGFLCFPGL